MKHLLKILSIGLILFGLQGCYTILWTPEEKITDQYETTSYYNGYAADYYDIPWWINVPVIVGYPGYTNSGKESVTKDRTNTLDSQSRNIRNNDGGRSPEIINTPPPTQSTPGSNPPSTGSGSGNNDSGSTVKSESSGSTSSGSGSRSNDTRNNSGNRNSGSGRK